MELESGYHDGAVRSAVERVDISNWLGSGTGEGDEQPGMGCGEILKRKF